MSQTDLRLKTELSLHCVKKYIIYTKYYQVSFTKGRGKRNGWTVHEIKRSLSGAMVALFSELWRPLTTEIHKDNECVSW